MRNQSEMAVSAALASFGTSGALNTAANRAQPVVAANYSALKLATDAQGIPTALQTNNFFSYGVATNDISSPDGSVIVRYVIDRLCSATGNELTLGATSCVVQNSTTSPGTGALNLQGAGVQLNSGTTAAVTQAVVFRLSVLVTGPRNTQSFFQSTFTVPS